jgi:hypothetical protein
MLFPVCSVPLRVAYNSRSSKANSAKATLSGTEHTGKSMDYATNTQSGLFAGFWKIGCRIGDVSSTSWILVDTLGVGGIVLNSRLHRTIHSRLHNVLRSNPKLGN